MMVIKYKKLCDRLCIVRSKVIEVHDYPHIKQNLNEFIDYFPKKAKNKKKIEKQIKISFGKETLKESNN
jgi:hypothetical protein